MILVGNSGFWGLKAKKNPLEKRRLNSRGRIKQAYLGACGFPVGFGRAGAGFAVCGCPAGLFGVPGFPGFPGLPGLVINNFPLG